MNESNGDITPASEPSGTANPFQGKPTFAGGLTAAAKHWPPELREAWNNSFFIADSAPHAGPEPFAGKVAQTAVRASATAASTTSSGPFPNSAQGSVWELTAMFQTPYSVTPNAINASTQELMFCSLPGTFVAGSLLGANGTMWVTTTSSSSLEFRCGNETSAVVFTVPIGAYQDGQPHHLEFGAGPAGIYVFLDGVLKASSTTSFLASGPALNFTSGVRSSGKNGGGSTSFGLGNVAFWSYLRHSKAFTPPTDYYTGMEPGLFAFFPLNGNLNCLL